jgi:maltodextrin utilization protein YvdJ
MRYFTTLFLIALLLLPATIHADTAGRGDVNQQLMSALVQLVALLQKQILDLQNQIATLQSAQQGISAATVSSAQRSQSSAAAVATAKIATASPTIPTPTSVPTIAKSDTSTFVVVTPAKLLSTESLNGASY